MSAAKLTPWFPVATPPVRDGVYQVSPCKGVIWLSLFESGVWHGTCGPSATVAVVREFGRRRGETNCHIREWRGLAEQPK